MSLTFCDTGHSGDKRKRSQPCFLELDNRDTPQRSLTVNVLLFFVGHSACLFSLSPGFAAVSSLHKTFGFSKSHVFLGVLGPITRARVTELISDDADRPCSPAHRES